MQPKRIPKSKTLQPEHGPSLLNTESVIEEEAPPEEPDISIEELKVYFSNALRSAAGQAEVREWCSNI
jgi:hypothetical protein